MGIMVAMGMVAAAIRTNKGSVIAIRTNKGSSLLHKGKLLTLTGTSTRILLRDKCCSRCCLDTIDKKIVLTKQALGKKVEKVLQIHHIIIKESTMVQQDSCSIPEKSSIPESPREHGGKEDEASIMTTTTATVSNFTLYGLFIFTALYMTLFAGVLAPFMGYVADAYGALLLTFGAGIAACTGNAFVLVTSALDGAANALYPVAFCRMGTSFACAGVMVVRTGLAFPTAAARRKVIAYLSSLVDAGSITFLVYYDGISGLYRVLLHWNCVLLEACGERAVHRRFFE